MSDIIYLDYQATSPIEPQVLDVVVSAYKNCFGNTSSRHYLGLNADSAVEKARYEIAKYLKIPKPSLYFTSGATESNNLAIKGIARSQKKGHFITVLTEHKSVIEPIQSLLSEGFEVTYLPVKRDGSIDLNLLRKEIRPDTILGSFMLVNNEIGTKHPISEIAQILHEKGIPLHCDATQGFPNGRVHPKDLGIDLMTCSGHKIYGPKGVGLLYLNFEHPSVRQIRPEILGGSQEKGLRAGTLNVPSILGFAKAFEILDRCLEKDLADNLKKRNLFLDSLPSGLIAFVNGPQEDPTPSNLSVTFDGLKATTVMGKLDHLMFGTGSACNSSSQYMSYVLAAIGLSRNEGECTIRVSFGRFTSFEEVEKAARSFSKLFNSKAANLHHKVAV